MPKLHRRASEGSTDEGAAGRVRRATKADDGLHRKASRGALLGGALVVALVTVGVSSMWMSGYPAASGAPLGGVSIGGPFELTEGVVPSAESDSKAGALSHTISGTAQGGAPKAGGAAGRRVSDRDFRGKFMLVYFGYTYCPDVCPTTLTDVAQALDKLGPAADRVQPIFITVDPKRDTPAVVAQYAAAFSSRLVGLTGTPDQIAAVAHEYRVYYAEHRTGPGANDYSMDHSSILYLMGPDGGFVSVIRADTGPDAIATELAKNLGAA